MVSNRILRLSAASVVALVAAALGAASLDAHEVSIHQRLTRDALRFLVSERPELAACGAREVEDILKEGVAREDDPTDDPLGYYFYHFFPQLGDIVEGRKFGNALAAGTCDSITWGLGLDPACSARIIVLPGSLQWTYRSRTDGQNPYAFDQAVMTQLKTVPGTATKAQGLLAVGHLVHLLQDLTSPAHTRNDGHPPKELWKFELGDPSMFEVVNAARALDPLPFPSPGTLIPASEFANERAAFTRLRDWTRANFYSEKNVLDGSGPAASTTDALGYVTDVNHDLLAWVDPSDGRATINAVVAKDQFDRLAPEAIRWTASLLNFIHENRAPLCEQQLVVSAQGDGLVTSTGDAVRSNPDDRISCGTDAPGSPRCTHYFPSGQFVELTATGGSFQGWLDSQGRPIPGCTGNSCRVRMDGSEPKLVTADFGGDPASGVYRVTAVDGRALPAPLYTNTQLLSGELRFLDDRPWFGIPQHGIQGFVEQEFRYLEITPQGPREVVGSGFLRTYGIGEVSDDPVPIPGTNVILPPGRIVHDGGDLPIATIVGGTMTYRILTGITESRMLTLVRQPPIRSVRFDPANRTLSFPDTRQEGTSPSRTITITNAGIEPLMVEGLLDASSRLNFSVSNVTAPACDLHAFFGAASPLAPGASCSVELRFTPNLSYRTGLRTGTVTWRTNAGSTSGTIFRGVGVVLEGVATGVPTLSVSAPNPTFPPTAAGSVSVQSVIVQNTGDVPLILFSPSSPNFGVDATGCRDRSLPAGASCSIVVSYRPPSQFTGTLNIGTNSGSTTGSLFTNLSVPLVATNGRPVADAGPDQPDVRPGSFAVVDGSASTDLEGFPVTYAWQVVSAPPGGAGSLVHTMPEVSGAQFVADVPGPYTLQLVVNDGVQDSLPDTVVVNVQPPPGVLVPSTLGLTFPATESRTTSQPIQVTNTGGRFVTITAASVSGDFGISSNTCTTLVPQASCTIEVYFEPTAPGPRSGELTIISDASNSTTRVLLSGALSLPSDQAPRVEAIGLLALTGHWQLRFFGGDDDEAVWVKIGNDPEFEWEEDEAPGRVVDVNFGTAVGLVRLAEDNDGEDLRPLTLELLPDGRYLLHLHDDDPPFEIELTLVLERVP